MGLEEWKRCLFLLGSLFQVLEMSGMAHFLKRGVSSCRSLLPLFRLVPSAALQP